MLSLHTKITASGLIAIPAEIMAEVASVAANVVDSLPFLLTKATIEMNETTKRAVPRSASNIFEALEFAF